MWRCIAALSKQVHHSASSCRALDPSWSALRTILSVRASGLDACFRDSISSSTQPDRPVEVLDEPTAFLDAESAQRVRAILAERARKRLVLVSTHDPELIKQAGKVLRLQVSDRQQAERLHHG